MFNNHTMSVVTNLNIVGPQINNLDFLTVVAVTTNYPELPNIFNASVLIPPTEMLMKWADGNPLVIQNEYPAYLETKDTDDMIVAILIALTQKNIILYIPADEFNIFGPQLLNHLYMKYGVTCNFGNTQFSINQTKVPFIMAKFYCIGVMEPQVFLDAYPGNILLPGFVIDKLSCDLQPFNGPTTFEQRAEYFNKLIASKVVNQAPKDMIQIKGVKP